VRKLPVTVDKGDQNLSLAWAADARSFYCLTSQGVLRRLALDDGKELKRLALGQRVNHLAVSDKALLITLDDIPELWLLDPETLEVKRKLTFEGLRNVATAPHLPIAVVNRYTSGLTILDLAKGTEVRHYSARAFQDKDTALSNAAFTPDGKYLFGFGSITYMHRFAVQGDELKWEEKSPFFDSSAREVVVSPDSKYACLAGGVGRHQKLAGFPKKPRAMYVFPVTTFTRPAFILDTDDYPSALGFDPKKGRVYVGGDDLSLTAYSAEGKRLRHYPIKKDANTHRLLVHPDNGKVVICSPYELYTVETDS
jgi:hypothetical protein